MKTYLATNKKNGQTQLMNEDEYLYWSTHVYYKSKWQFSLIPEKVPAKLPDDFETIVKSPVVKKKSTRRKTAKKSD